MPPTSSDIKSSTTDSVRLQAYRNHLEMQNQAQVKDITENHEDQVTRLLENQTKTKDELQKAFDLQISTEAETLDERLRQVRSDYENRIDSEKKSGDKEIDKLKQAHQERVKEYKKNSEQQLSKMHKEMQAAAEGLHERAKKSAKRNKEVSES